MANIDVSSFMYVAINVESALKAGAPASGRTNYAATTAALVSADAVLQAVDKLI